MDIEFLYKAVPQLAKVFRIIDKIGEGTCSSYLYPFFSLWSVEDTRLFKFNTAITCSSHPLD